MNIKLRINRVRPAAAFALLCVVFSFSATAQDDHKKPLNGDEVKNLVARLKASVVNMNQYFSTFEDRDLQEIFKGWDARRDLVGKTRDQVLDLLKSDYYSSADGREADNWESYIVPGLEDQPVKDDPAEKRPAEPVNEAAKPDKTGSSEEPIAPNSIRYYFANLPTDADTEAWELGLLAAAHSNHHLGHLVGLVFHRDKDGKLTGTGYFDLDFAPTGSGPDGFVKTVESKEVGGKKIVITGTKKAQ